CKNDLDKFCYICGEYIPQKQKVPITQNIKTCYFHIEYSYFNIEIKSLNKPWVPHTICTTC
ncbi:hypothetical protein EAI_07982, partial [Harpegnathos saltator]